jgi:hypothetical protein
MVFRLIPMGYEQGHADVFFFILIRYCSIIYSSPTDHAKKTKKTYKIEWRREGMHFTHSLFSYAFGSLFD